MNIIFKKQDLINRVNEKLKTIKKRNEEKKGKWYKEFKEVTTSWINFLTNLNNSSYNDMDDAVVKYFEDCSTQQYV